MNVALWLGMGALWHQTRKTLRSLYCSVPKSPIPRPFLAILARICSMVSFSLRLAIVGHLLQVMLVVTFHDNYFVRIGSSKRLYSQFAWNMME